MPVRVSAGFLLSSTWMQSAFDRCIRFGPCLCGKIPKRQSGKHDKCHVYENARNGDEVEGYEEARAFSPLRSRTTSRLAVPATSWSRLNRLMIRIAVSVEMPTMLAMSSRVIRTKSLMP